MQGAPQIIVYFVRKQKNAISNEDAHELPICDRCLLSLFLYRLWRQRAGYRSRQPDSGSGQGKNGFCADQYSDRNGPAAGRWGYVASDDTMGKDVGMGA